MAEFQAATPDQAEFLEALFASGLLVRTGASGVYGRSGTFEDIRLRFDGLVTRSTTDQRAEPLRFPPVLPREQFERTGYLKSFPHLAGAVFGFSGTESEALEQYERSMRHEDWSAYQRMTGLVLVPAVCYPVYPAIAARGPLPEGGVTIDPGGSYVFRHEPSDDPSRLTMFHMRELVRIGEPDAVAEWRDAWITRGLELLRGLGLSAERDVASDPFFGRTGRMLAASQREQALKVEILVQVAGPSPTAIASFNYHQNHFATMHGLRLADGGEAHTACLGFGHERIVLALLRTHGLDPATWPADVRAQLWDT
jgi:seryl-tRNA synthetase